MTKPALRFSLEPRVFHLLACFATGGLLVSLPLIFLQNKTSAYILLFCFMLFTLSLFLYLKKNSTAKEQALADMNTELAEKTRLLSESEAKLRSTIDLAVDAILMGDATGNIMGANRRAAEMTGYSVEELCTLHIKKLFYKESLIQKPLRFDLLKEGKTVISCRNILRKDGLLVPVEMNSKMMPDGTCHAFIRDLSERNRMEEEMRKHQHLDSLNILAGGIAHDFNNLLSGIYGFIGLARTRLISHKDIPAAITFLSHTDATLNQARNLSSQLLAFAKGGTLIKKSTSIAEIIHNSSSFALAGSTASCKTNLPEDLWLCNVDAGQISQLINNLFINAVQAMPYGGSISVSANNKTLDNTNTQSLIPGKYVHIEISDTGMGIPAEDLPRIFSPFFSTKEKGTGLGLTICYSIALKHGGCIYAHSELDKGSTFTVLLPAHADRQLIPAFEPQTSIDIQGKRILIMDDEPAIQRVASMTLTAEGCITAIAVHGEEAVHLFSRALADGQAFDAVILDLTIRGGTGGIKTAALLREINPYANLIASSGYADDNAMNDPTAYGFKSVLKKPYDTSELIRVVGAACS